MRITPQVGVNVVNFKHDFGSKEFAISATAGARFEYAIDANFGVSASADGCFAVSKEDSFKMIEEVSSKVKGWGTGANLRLGIYVSF